MKKYIALIILTAAAIALPYFFPPVARFFHIPIGNVVDSIGKSQLAGQVQDLGNQLFEPAPLKNSKDSNGNRLTISGVITETNISRKQNGGLAPLTENAKLDEAASRKLKDMFQHQYFEHVNPQGVGAAGLAKAVGYDYITIGENLALGNFDGDADLVLAWMNSPGHRANILHANFQEIGVAVGQGIFEGKQTWLAVQEFGRPKTSCPGLDPNLKAQINSLEADVAQIQPQVDALKSQIDSSEPKTAAQYDAYNKTVAQYNALVKIYNNKVDNLKIVTEQYNAQVRAYNACAKSTN